MRYIEEGLISELGWWAAAAGGDFVGENVEDKVAMVSSAVARDYTLREALLITYYKDVFRISEY